MDLNNGINMNLPNSTSQITIDYTTSVSKTNSEHIVLQDNKSGNEINKDEYVSRMAEKTVMNAIEQANIKLLGSNKEIRMTIHEATKRINTKIVDKETNEVIVEYPPEKLLDIFAKMIELSGLFVDEKR